MGLTRYSFGTRLFDFILKLITDASAPEKRYVVDACNAALQELVANAPRESFRKSDRRLVRAPVAIVLDVTEGSATLANVAPWAAWMVGCTVAIGGKNYRFRSQTALNGEFCGNTGAATAATVYQDALALDPDQVNVLEPVIVDDAYPLAPIPTEHYAWYLDREWWRARPWDYGDAGARPGPAGGVSASGLPSCYLVHTEHAGAGIPDLRYLRLRPLPAGKTSVSWESQIAFATWAEADVTAPSGDGLLPLGIPLGWEEYILLPIAKQRLVHILRQDLAATPNSTNIQHILDTVYAEYSQALMALERMKPQLDGSAEIRVEY